MSHLGYVQKLLLIFLAILSFVGQDAAPQALGSPDTCTMAQSTSRLGQITKRIFVQRGLPMQPLVEIESVEGLKEMVRQGIGVTLTLPALIRPAQIGNDLVLLPITDVPEEFIFALIYRRVGSISRAAREFINVISQQIMKNM